MSGGVPGLWGLMAVFETPENLLEAVRETRKHGFERFDAYSPFPFEELLVEIDQAEGSMNSGPIAAVGVAPICWIGGFIGASGGFWLMCWHTIFRFPLNVGGRPYFSWPAYIPITFELMILFGGVSTFIGVLALNRLPRYYHPVFNVEEFQKRNSNDGFFLVIEASDLKFSAEETHGFLRSLKPSRTYEVPDLPGEGRYGL